MTKRLVQKVGWIVVCVAVVGAIILVAGQEQAATEKYERDRQTRCHQWSSTPAQEDACKHEHDSGSIYLNRWYVLLVWPNGIEVWAIILTGFFVGWQAWLTRQMAAHVDEQTGILQQSADVGKGTAVPTLRILKFNMVGSDPLIDNEMELTVRNYGATPAILDALFISFDDGERQRTTEGTPVAFADKGGQAVGAGSEGTLYCSPTICLVSPRQIRHFRDDMKNLYVRGRLKYLDVFESPVRSLRFDVCLRQRQDKTISCEIIGQWNEYDNHEKPN
jgi:hypothetical protein